METTDYPELAGLVPRDRAQTIRLMRSVKELESLIRAGREKGYLAKDIVPAYVGVLRERGMKTSRSTLLKWRRAYNQNGLSGLVDLRLLTKRARPSKRGLHPTARARRFLYEIGEFLKLVKVRYPSGRFSRQFELAWMYAEEEANRCGWNQCTYRQAARWARQLEAGATLAKELMERR